MSNVAEESIEAIPSESLQARRRALVLKHLKEHPGETNEEISEALGLPIQSVTPRTRELKERGRIWITGKRETSSGRMAAEMSPASCPLCGAPPESIAYWGEGGFVYRCTCGCEYVALVGPSRNLSVVVRTMEEAMG